MQAEKRELAKYRAKKALECLADSQAAFAEGRLVNSINRSYYAMFHMTRALLALAEFDSKKHSGIISYFNQHYVANGKIGVQYNKMLSSAFQIRNQSDYNDFYVVSRDEAERQLHDAVQFIDFMTGYIQELTINSDK